MVITEFFLANEVVVAWYFFYFIPWIVFREGLFYISESLRISTVTFDRFSQWKITTGTIPNGYAGFNWENAFYMLESCVTESHPFNGFANACKHGRKSMAFNGRGAPLSIFLSNQGKTFGLHSFEAISIYHENFKLSITSYRSNDVFDTKTIILTKNYPILIEIDWEQIDRIKFSSAGINQDSSKPKTFALTYLNLLIWDCHKSFFINKHFF